MIANRLTKTSVQKLLQFIPLLVSGASMSTALEAVDAESEEFSILLLDYYRLMEIAHFIRRGGVKAMIYRVETGKTNFVPVDYYDEAYERLSSRYHNIVEVQAASGPQSLLEELRGISEEEEQLVAELLPQLDALLLADRRQEASLIDERRSI